MQLKRLLVPVDFSECSRRALQYASALALPSEASVDALHAWMPPHLVPGEMLIHLPGHDPVSIRAWAESEVKRELDGFCQPFIRDGHRVTPFMSEGQAHEVILEWSARPEYDLVVMGTVGRTGIARLVLGSVTEKVVRSASKPVLTIHLRDE